MVYSQMVFKIKCGSNLSNIHVTGATVVDNISAAAEPVQAGRSNVHAPVGAGRDQCTVIRCKGFTVIGDRQGDPAAAAGPVKQHGEHDIPVALALNGSFKDLGILAFGVTAPKVTGLVAYSPIIPVDGVG